ncbi:hypothetical protein NB717_002772 [Xanthomonas sacchari]|nr:hypothetical protein [Xanthomonas sacchari]MCW0424372.1 hypothetical protein [Xanthomonas sacchari]MCW0449595.1 hypothetical protein [Xanthomonas sacchari]MCW0461704.1 hypothetical protein [Xanthomonas sacchari]
MVTASRTKRRCACSIASRGNWPPVASRTKSRKPSDARRTVSRRVWRSRLGNTTSLTMPVTSRPSTTSVTRATTRLNTFCGWFTAGSAISATV